MTVKPARKAILKDLTTNTFAGHLLHYMSAPAFSPNTRHQIVIWNCACEQLTGLREYLVRLVLAVKNVK